MVARDERWGAGGSSTSTSWTRWIVSGLLIAFLVTDAIPKIFKAGFSVDGTVELGYPESTVIPIGVVLLISTLLYAVLRTAVIGAILLTGYLGGAIATQLRLEEYGWLWFPAAMAVLVWVGLMMRDARVNRFLFG